MDELSKINKDFNESLDDTFSLTKMFKQGGLFAKTVNIVLSATVLFGAFKGLETISHTEPKTQYYEMIQEAQETFKNPVEITTNNIKEIAESRADGVFQSHSEGQLVVVVNKTGQGIGGEKQELVDDLLEINNLSNQESSFASTGSSNFNKGIPFSQMMNLSFDSLEGNEIGFLMMSHNNLSGLENFKSINENLDLIVFAHELSHVGTYQNDYQKDLTKNQTYGHELAIEMASDLFSALVVSKANNMDMKETTNLMQEMSLWRKDNLRKYHDTGHSTNIALDSFIKTLNDNPNYFKEVQNLNLKSIDKLSMDYSKEIFNDLNIKAEKNSDLRAEGYEQNVAKMFDLLNYKPSVSLEQKIDKDFKNNIDSLVFVQEKEAEENELYAELTNDIENKEISFRQDSTSLTNSKLKI